METRQVKRRQFIHKTAAEPARSIFALFDREAKALPFLIRTANGKWIWWHEVPNYALTSPGRDWIDAVRYSRCDVLEVAAQRSAERG
jgi:hypothetical protein